MTLPKRGSGGPENIARVLPKRVHSAAYARVRLFRQESRKSKAENDYRCLLIGIPKIAFGVRIPVVRLPGHGPRIDSNSRIGNRACNGSPPMITPTVMISLWTSSARAYRGPVLARGHRRIGLQLGCPCMKQQDQGTFSHED